MENSSFTETLLKALNEKSQWYDNEELPRLLEEYRMLHTCVKTLFDFAIKKAVITPDPYKLDKKISDITTPDNSQFIESERSVFMGQRFSDYESTLDFLCNYYKFSVSHITIQNIKKLVDFTNAIQWTSFSINSNKINTRVLATIIFDARQNSDPMTASMVNDSLSKASKAVTEIMNMLKAFSEFQKENYKGLIRKNVIANPHFDGEKAKESISAEIQQIKKNFTSGMGKIPFYNELIEEIAQEDLGPNKEAMQKEVLAKLTIEKHESHKKETKVDTKAILMTAIQVLGAMPPQLLQILQKIQENHDILESEHNSFFDKLKKSLRKAFGLEEKPLYYMVTITDASTGAKRHDRINYQTFVNDLTIKSRRYTSVAQKNSPGFLKISSLPEEKIFDFLSSQISECNKMLVIANALDEYFKSAASPVNKPKIKGLKIDLTTLKNSVIKANQHRVEYSAYIEEEAQMRKLGITQ